MTTETKAGSTQEAEAERLAAAEAIRRGEMPTAVSRRTAVVVSVVFLAMIFLLPVGQAVWELVRTGRVQAVEVFTRTPTRENLRGFEGDLEKASVAKGAVQPVVQEALTAAGGFGNSKVTLGREGWLFFQPGVDMVMGPGLLDEGRLRQVREALRKGDTQAAVAGLASRPGTEEPDPRGAIVDFHRQCAAAGVELIVVPIPDKASLQPAQMTRRLANYSGPAVENGDYRRLVGELRAAGVNVLDVTPESIYEYEYRFLRQDTHWTPEWMAEVAEQVAGEIRRRTGWERGGVEFSVRELKVSRVGDLVDMLQLGEKQSIFVPQEVTVRQVVDGEGKPYAGRDGAEVVLLGDSFSNIYSLKDMGWGEGAGFGQHVALALGRDVEIIARNGSGASMTRRELARRRDPLGGRKVIVWQFAARDLWAQDWQVIPLKARGAATTATAAEGEIVLTGELVTEMPTIDVSAVPYQHAMGVVKFRVLKVERGAHEGGEVLVSVPLMIDRKLTAHAGLKVGEKRVLTLTAKEPKDGRGYMVLDETGEFGLQMYWAVEIR